MAFAYIVRAKTAERETATGFLLAEPAQIEAHSIVRDLIAKHNDKLLNKTDQRLFDLWAEIPDRPQDWRKGVKSLQIASIRAQGLPLEDEWSLEELEEGSGISLTIEEVPLRFSHELEGEASSPLDRAEERLRDYHPTIDALKEVAAGGAGEARDLARKHLARLGFSYDPKENTPESKELPHTKAYFAEVPLGQGDEGDWRRNFKRGDVIDIDDVIDRLEKMDRQSLGWLYGAAAYVIRALRDNPLHVLTRPTLPDVKSVEIAMEANVPKPRWAITYNGLAMENISTGDILQFDAQTGCVRRMLFGEAR